MWYVTYMPAEQQTDILAIEAMKKFNVEKVRQSGFYLWPALMMA